MYNPFVFQILTYTADICQGKSFLGIPPWYQYLYPKYISVNPTSKVCEFNLQLVQGGTLNLSALTLVGLGILDILLRIGALVAVGYIVYAGFRYLTAQGEPDKAKQALGTIINALVGLGITIVAAAVVRFIGKALG
jgi:hypothetical protein